MNSKGGPVRAITALNGLLASSAFALFPNSAFAHAFGERYDLPVPMSWVITAASLVMVLTLLLTAFWPSPHPSQHSSPHSSSALFLNDHVSQSISPGEPKRLNAWGCLGVFFLVFCTLCANLGTQDPLMNFSPTFIWIIWWLGTSLGVVLFGNFWPHINPWLTIERWINSQASQPPLHYPRGLGQWPAVLMILCWCALEVVYPIASMPERLSWWITAFSAYMLLGMSLFGHEAWTSCADGFSVYFDLLGSGRKGKFSLDPFQAQPSNFSAQLSQVAFVIAMFASVLFDGLHASQMWPSLEAKVMHWGILSHDLNGYHLGVLELLCVWGCFVCTYLLICTLSSAWIQHKGQQHFEISLSPLALAHYFSFSLTPIAIAYLLAHNFSTFFIQAQSIIALASDPLGWQWDLFGTAKFEVDVSFIDAKLTWYVATSSIVIGHVISILKSHQSAERLLLSLNSHLKANDAVSKGLTVKAWQLNIPLTVLMIAFTALSLAIIAEPLANG